MGQLKDLQGTDRSGLSTIPLFYLYIAKGIQMFDTGLGVDRANNGGWNPLAVLPLAIQDFSYGGVLPKAPNSQITTHGPDNLSPIGSIKCLHGKWEMLISLPADSESHANCTMNLLIGQKQSGLFRAIAHEHRGMNLDSKNYGNLSAP